MSLTVNSYIFAACRFHMSHFGSFFISTSYACASHACTYTQMHIQYMLWKFIITEKMSAILFMKKKNLQHFIRTNATLLN